MAFTAKDVKDLREKTGVGMMDCKKALTEVDGNIDKAVDYLRKKGMAAAEKKASRVAAEGLVGSYIHGGRIGVMVEVNCETDFVTKNEDFKAFVHDVAMHIAAADPKFVAEDEMDQEFKNKEAEIKSILLYKYLIGYHELIRYKKQSKNYLAEVKKEINQFIKY